MKTEVSLKSSIALSPLKCVCVRERQLLVLVGPAGIDVSASALSKPSV